MKCPVFISQFGYMKDSSFRPKSIHAQIASEEDDWFFASLDMYPNQLSYVSTTTAKKGMIGPLVWDK